MKILIVDTKSAITEGIAAFIKQKWAGALPVISHDADKARRIANEGTHTVLINMHLDGIDAVELAKDIKRDTCGYARILFILDSPNIAAVRLALSARTSGVLLKTDPSEEMYRAIEMAMKGQLYVPPSMSYELHNPESKGDGLDRLTPRERVILTLMAHGRVMKEIASRMNISIKTAETHRNNLGRKLGHPNRAQLFAFALKHGLISESRWRLEFSDEGRRRAKGLFLMWFPYSNVRSPPE